MVAGAPRAVRPFMAARGCGAVHGTRRPAAGDRGAEGRARDPRAHTSGPSTSSSPKNFGVTDAEIEAIGKEEPVTSLDEECNLICRVADEVSRDVRLSDEALEQIIDRYGPREAAELILLVSYYNMVSRFLESTRVEIENEPLLKGRTPDSITAGQGTGERLDEARGEGRHRGRRGAVAR